MVGWEFGHLFCVSGTDDVTEQKNNSLETIPSRFSLNRKQRSLLLSCFALRNLCPVHEVLSGNWNPLISGQIVNSFGQGKCTFDCQSWNFKNHVSTSSSMLRIEKLINFNLYVDISYKFTFARVFVSHACTQINLNALNNNSVLMRVPHIQ